MKRLKRKVACILFVICAGKGMYSQTIVELLNNPDLTYYQIEQALESNKSILDNATPKEKKRYLRWKTFWDTRVDENGGFTRFGEEMAKYSRFFPEEENKSFKYQNVGPDPSNLTGDKSHIGRICAIWINPSNLNEIVIGTNNAGIWKSYNGGTTWEHKTANYWFGVQDFTVDNTRGIIYAATGIYANGILHHGRYGAGIYQSTDWGETWLPLQENVLLENTYLIHELLVSANGQKMFKLQGSNLYVSHDHGSTFAVIPDVPGPRFIRENPANPLQICISGSQILYTSEDGGETWINRYEQLQQLTSTTYNYMVSADYSIEGTLWINAAIPGSGGVTDASTIARSYNNGGQLEKLFNDLTSVGAIVGGSVYIEAHTDNRVYLGGGFISRIVNNGSQYEYLSYYPSDIPTVPSNNIWADIRDICIPIPENPDLVYVATDGGISKSTTGGWPRELGWQRIYGNLSLTECYYISANRSNEKELVIGTHDNGGYSTLFEAGKLKWKNTQKTGDAGACLIGFNNQVSERFVDVGGVLFTYETYYDRWKEVPKQQGAVAGFGRSYSLPMAQNSNSSSKYIAMNYTGGICMIKKFTTESILIDSNNPYASAWGWEWGDIKAIKIPRYDDNTIFYVANTSRRFYIRKKTDNVPGTQGNLINYNLNNILIQDTTLLCKVTGIETHDTDPNIIWVTTGNFAAGKKVFQLDANNQTWTNISYNLPNVPLNDIAYDSNTNTLFVATDCGVYFLSEALPLVPNRQWLRSGDFPFVIASDLEIHHKTSQLFVATYGRGVWKTDLTCYYNPNPLVIDQDETWVQSKKAFNKDVVVAEGATLQLLNNTSVKFVAGAKLIIQPGAKVILTSQSNLSNSCGEQWSGVQLMGNQHLPQTPENQATLEMNNYATISNAKYGIYVGNPDTPGNGGGAILKIDGARLYDCEFGVYFSPYENTNASYIKNATFRTSENYKAYGDKPYAHVFLHGVKGVQIFGNIFRNSSYGMFETNNRGYGILVKESILTIGGASANSFRDLTRGIWNLSSSGFSDVQVLNNVFVNNFTAIEMAGFYKGKASGNTITLGDDGLFGFFMNNLEHFRIENNSITGNGSKIGMVVQNSTMANEIYKNTFNNLGTAFYGYSNPNLKLTCNTFNNNLYQINTANDGISPNQGTMLMSAGNVFIPDCSGTTNELNATEINYKKLSYFYFNNPLADEEPLCHNDNVRLYETTVQNGCSSKVPLEPEELETRYQALNSTIGEQENNLVQLVDGGSTPKTVNAIENVDEGQEINLMTDLMDKSPFLSEEALVKTAVEEDVLPAIIVANVLEANPQAAKSVEVQTALDNRANPMPDYLRQMIDQGLDIVSAKEELEMALGENKMLKEQVLSDIITAYLNDETIDRSADAEALMLAENSASYDYLMVNRYLSTNRMTEAQTLFNAMPGKYGFSDAQMAEYNQMAQIVAIHVALGHANYFELTAEQKAQLYLLAEDGATRAGALARGILVLVDRAEFPVPEITIPEGGNKNQRITTEEKPVFSFTVQPTPANDYFVVEYNLATKDFETAELRLFNNQGKQVYQQKLTKQAFQLLITTKQFEPGIYLCRLYKDNKEVVETQYFASVLVIKPNQLTDPQAVEQSELLLEGQQFFLVYPNPTTVDVTVCSSRTRNCTIEVYDERGQVVNRLSKVSATNTINTRGLKPGVYHVRLVENGKVVETVKLVVQ